RRPGLRRTPPDGPHPRGRQRRLRLRRQRVQGPRTRPEGRRQGLPTTPRAQKNGYEGSSIACPSCDRAAAYHDDREHTLVGLCGPVRCRRAYYYCRACGRGFFPFDQTAGVSTRRLTPAAERLATLAGAVADSFDKGAALLAEMAAVRLSEATVQRTTQDVGRRIEALLGQGYAFGPPVAWPWRLDARGRSVAYFTVDATGTR